MTSVVGKIQAFNPQTERFSTYVERLKLYFDANSVVEAKKVPVFLTVIGSRNYSLLSDHYAPDKPKDQSLEDLISTLQTHFEPEPIVIAERYHFYKRNQQIGESIPDFVANLRRLAANCKFGQHLDEALRDRFVCGLNLESVQQKLLLEKDLTMSKALELALSLSSADKTSLVMHASNPNPSDPVVQILHRDGPTKRPCYRCGKTGHVSDHCRFREATCHSCGKIGHISPVCRSRRKERGAQPTRKEKEKPKETNHLVAADSASDDSPLFTLRDSNSHPPISFKLKLDGTDIDMELDTGAAMSLISEATRDSLFSTVELRPSDVVLRTYTSEVVSVVGEF